MLLFFNIYFVECDKFIFLFLLFNTDYLIDLSDNVFIKSLKWYNRN